MKISQFEVLVAIVDSGSLSEAAEVVSLTQSAVSYSLSKLEAELGVTLLERSGRGITVTRIGEEILAHARHILAELDVIRQITARERGMSTGSIRLGCVPQLNPRLLTGIIRDFHHRYPDIDITLFEGNPQELLDWMEKGVINVTTVITPEDHRRSVLLAQDDIVVLISTRNPLADKTTISLSELHDHPLIGPKATYGMVTAMPQLQKLTLPRLRYEVSTYSTIYAMVREDLGISLAPGNLLQAKDEGIAVLPVTPPITVQIYLASNIDSPATHVFLSNAHRWASDNGYLNTNA